jgi:2-alkenal reductase
MRRTYLSLVASILLAAGLACNSFAPTPAPAPPTAPAIFSTPAPVGSAPTPPPIVNLITTSEEQLLIELYQRVNPAVVAILVETSTGGSQGSGFLYDVEGHVVTNNHVVQEALNIEVDFASGFKTHGRVVGADPDSDLAVVKLDELPPGGVTPLPLGDSDQLQVGQRVLAIGNPFGLEGTMTMGIVSALGRTVPGTRSLQDGTTFSTPDVIQTDAAINPGNSGGPLLNLSGEVVGINAQIDSETGTNSGVGFAIASNTVRQVAPYLIAEGRFVYPYLGVESQEEISLFLQDALTLPQATGAYVRNVVPGGPAETAGLRGDSARAGQELRGDGDLIIAIDGREVKVFSDLLSHLVNHTRPGQTVTLTVLRGGQTVEVPVVLGERP